MDTSKMNLLATVPTQVDANIANARRFPHAMNAKCYEHRLQSRTQSGIASGGSVAPFKPSEATEKTTLKNAALNRGGYPVILGFVARITQSIVLPDVSATATRAAVSTIYERCALHTINVNPGKAGSNYLMGKTGSLGRLMKIFDTVGGFSQIMKGMRTATTENTVSVSRASRDSVGAVRMASDTSGGMQSRTIIDDLEGRTTWTDSAALADRTLPNTGTQFQDCLFFPLTLDGEHGIVDAGILFDDIFTPSPLWQFDLTLNNNTDLFPTVASGGAAAVFGTYTVEWSCIYRVSPKSLGAICEGSVWRLNDTLGKVTAGVQSILNADQVNDHVFVGFLPRLWEDSTDGGSFYYLHVDANGAGAAYTPKLRIVSPTVNPAVNFNTDGVFLRVGDGTEDVLPANPDDLLSRGDTILTEWNGRFESSAIHDPTDVYPEGREIPRFADAGLRASTTTLCIDAAVDQSVGAATVRYGATYQAGANVAFNAIPLGSDAAQVALGGLPHLPIAWTDNQANGFPGVATRTPDDKRPIAVNTVGSFAFPATSPTNATVWPVSAITRSGPYSHMKSGTCEPCGRAGISEPVLKNEDSPKAAVGALLTASFAIPQTKPTVL